MGLMSVFGIDTNPTLTGPLHYGSYRMQKSQDNLERRATRYKIVQINKVQYLLKLRPEIQEK